MKRELCDDLAGVMAERDRLRDQVARLRADEDRLDWIEANRADVYEDRGQWEVHIDVGSVAGDCNTAREAIDMARRVGSNPGDIPGGDPVPPTGYLWQVRAEYTGGTSQSWPVDDEVSARNEYLLILAEQAAGAHEELAGLAIERRPVRPWEPVCSTRFDAAAAERG